MEESSNTPYSPLLDQQEPSIQMARTSGGDSSFLHQSGQAAPVVEPGESSQGAATQVDDNGDEALGQSVPTERISKLQKSRGGKAGNILERFVATITPYDMFATQPVVPTTCIGKCSTILVVLTLVTIVLVQLSVAYSTDQYVRTDSSMRDISGPDCQAVVGFTCESAVCYIAFQGPFTQAANRHLLESDSFGFNQAAAGSVLTISGTSGFAETVNLRVCAGAAGEAIDVSGGSVLNLPPEASNAIAAFPGVPGQQQAFHVFAAEGGAGMVRYSATAGQDSSDDDASKAGFTQLVPTALVAFGSTAPETAVPAGVARWRHAVGSSCWEGPAGAPQRRLPNCTAQQATEAAPPKYVPPVRTAAGLQPALLQGSASALYVTAQNNPLNDGDASVYAWYVLSQRSAGMAVTSHGSASGGSDARGNFAAGPYDVLFSPEQLLLAAGVPPSPIVNAFGRGFSQVSPTQAIFAVTRCGGDPDGVASNGSWPIGVWQGDPNIPYVHASVEFLLVSVSPRELATGVDNADWADWAVNSSSPVVLQSVRRLGTAAGYLTRSQFGLPTQPPHGCPAATAAFAAFPKDDFPTNALDFHHYFVVSTPSAAGVGPQFGPTHSQQLQPPQALPAVVYDLKVDKGILQFRKLSSAVGHFQAKGGLGWAAVPSYVCSAAAHIHSHSATLGTCNDLQLPADVDEQSTEHMQVPTVSTALAVHIDLGSLSTTRVTAIPHARVLSQALSMSNDTLVFANAAASGDLYSSISPFCSGYTECSVSDDTDTIAPQGLPRVLPQPSDSAARVQDMHLHLQQVHALASADASVAPLSLALPGAKHNFNQSHFAGVPRGTESTLQFDYGRGIITSAAAITLPLKGTSALSHFSYDGRSVGGLCEGTRASEALLMAPGMGSMWAQQVLLQCSDAEVGRSYGPFTTATDSAGSQTPGSSSLLLAATAPALAAWATGQARGGSSTALLVGLTAEGLEIETHIGTLRAPEYDSIFPLELQDVPQYFGLQGILARSGLVYHAVDTEVSLGGRLPGAGTPFMGLTGVATTFAVSNTTYQSKFPYFDFPPRMLQRWVYAQPLVMDTQQLPCGSAPPRVAPNSGYGAATNIASFLQAGYPCVRFNVQAQYTISMQYLTHDIFSVAASVGGLSTAIVSGFAALVWYIRSSAKRRAAAAARRSKRAA